MKKDDHLRKWRYLIKSLQIHAFQTGNFIKPVGDTTPEILDGGVTRYPNIPYPSRLPNSFLDLYTHGKQTEKPLLIYIHGGGCAWGDKAWKDEQDFKYWLITAGYDMVSFNYALSPEYGYPTPVFQLNEALSYIPVLGEQYMLNTKRIVFVGSSAGSQLCGQLINLSVNPDYAEEMNFEPALSKDQIAGALLGSPLLDSERFDRTGVKLIDWLFHACGSCYFGIETLQGDARVKESSVMNHITCNFPPTFLTDGNWGSFTDQAVDFKNCLDELGVHAELNLYPRSRALLLHGYETGKSACARDNRKQMLNFLDSLEE